MKTRLLCLSLVTFLGGLATSYAGWGGWCGPAFGVGVVAPVPVYRPVYYAPAPVYYAAPAPVYVRTVRIAKPVATVSSTLVRAQAQLANLGYYKGPVDGDFGPLTSRAVAQYQADYGLAVNGRLDKATLKSLGI